MRNPQALHLENTPHSLQVERAHVQQQRPSTAKNFLKKAKLWDQDYRASIRCLYLRLGSGVLTDTRAQHIPKETKFSSSRICIMW